MSTPTTGCMVVPGIINCICWANMAAAVFCWIRLFRPLISSWVFRCAGGWRYLQFSRVQRPWGIMGKRERRKERRARSVSVLTENLKKKSTAPGTLYAPRQTIIQQRHVTLICDLDVRAGVIKSWCNIPSTNDAQTYKVLVNYVECIWGLQQDKDLVWLLTLIHDLEIQAGLIKVYRMLSLLVMHVCIKFC